MHSLSTGWARASSILEAEELLLCTLPRLSCFYLGGGHSSLGPALQAPRCAASRRVLKVTLPVQGYSHWTTSGGVILSKLARVLRGGR